MLGISLNGLDELLQRLVLNVYRRPFRNLIAGKISTKLHGGRPDTERSVEAMIRWKTKERF